MGVVIPMDTHQANMPDYFNILLTKPQIWVLRCFKFNLHSGIY